MEYRDLGLNCEHCGKAIESKPDHKTISIVGFEAMTHRHIHDKSKRCVIHIEGVAAPYSDQGNSDRYFGSNKEI